MAKLKGGSKRAFTLMLQGWRPKLVRRRDGWIRGKHKRAWLEKNGEIRPVRARHIRKAVLEIQRRSVA